MQQTEIKMRIEKLRADKERQRQRVIKIMEDIETLKVKLSKENEKLIELENKVEQQEYYLLKEKFADFGISGEDGIEDLLMMLEEFGKSQKENRSDETR